MKLVVSETTGGRNDCNSVIPQEFHLTTVHCSVYSIALQFSQSVISFFRSEFSIPAIIASRITKPQLNDGKVGFVCQKTAVHSPYLWILITVTNVRRFDTRVVLSTGAAIIPWTGPIKVEHFFTVTWHPPCKFRRSNSRVQTLISDELLAIGGKVC